MPPWSLMLPVSIMLFSGVVSAADTEPALAGKNIYREGILPSGAPLQGRVQNGVELSGGDAACVKCHRRSGLGGSEGQNTIRPIAGHLLFSRPEIGGSERARAPLRANDARAPYTIDSLARVLREGVDPSGREIDPLMPRFILSDEEITSLTAYLKSLSATADPGVTATDIHFATIVAADASEQKRNAMLEMMQAFFRDKNANTRQEGRRRAIGSEPMYRNYRSWVLHVWALSGPPEGWRGQLEEYYRKQPVFAVIGGVGGSEWRPVHAFCEEQAIPCVFPNVNFPVVSGASHHSIYFSQGVALEARALAKYLSSDPMPRRQASIMQVFRDDDSGRMQAQALRSALLRHGIEGLVDRPVSGPSPVSGAFWTSLLREDRPDRLVIWLNGEDIKELAKNEIIPYSPEGVYFSASLLAMERPPLSDAWLAKARLIYPFALPVKREQNLRQMRVWLGAKKIPLIDEIIQGGTYFTLTTVGDVVSHMLGIFSREYFIEGIERTTEISSFFSVYPRLSLGPDQRFASKGSYVVGFSPDGENAVYPLSDWIVP